MFASAPRIQFGFLGASVLVVEVSCTSSSGLTYVLPSACSVQLLCKVFQKSWFPILAEVVVILSKMIYSRPDLICSVCLMATVCVPAVGLLAELFPGLLVVQLLLSLFPAPCLALFVLSSELGDAGRFLGSSYHAEGT